jgi:uncharacterized protein
MTSHAAVLRPVGSRDRIELLDVLRGFAVLGILLVNFSGESGTRFPRADAAAQWILSNAVEGSFYPLFSFLFGLGFGIQVLRAQERGTGAAHLHLRRMLVLFIIGTLHSLLIYEGDILQTYATFGLPLLLLGRLPSRALLAVICLTAAVQLAGEPVRDAVRTWRIGDPQVEYLRQAARMESAEIENNLRSDVATYATARALSWTRYSREIHGLQEVERVVLNNEILLLFIIGLYVAKRRVFETAADHRRGFLLLAAVSVLTIVGSHGYTVMNLNWGRVASSLQRFASTKGPTFLYIALIALLCTSVPRAARVLRVFAAPGRMALTSYLTQTIVLTLTFAPYGLGLPKFSIAAQVLFCLAFFFLVQVPAANWWLTRYQFGPAEWLWRSLTYGRVQPLRIAAPIGIATPPPHSPR